MLAEFQFEDIIFGLFPKAGSNVEDAFACWAKNSVGNVMDMLMQALEVSKHCMSYCWCDDACYQI